MTHTFWHEVLRNDVRDLAIQDGLAVRGERTNFEVYCTDEQIDALYDRANENLEMANRLHGWKLLTPDKPNKPKIFFTKA